MMNLGDNKLGLRWHETNPLLRRTPDPHLAPKFFAVGAQNPLFSLRFRIISDAKVGAKGRFGTL
jgi:hypothetical protein